jgi:hypothetical protein
MTYLSRFLPEFFAMEWLILIPMSTVIANVGGPGGLIFVPNAEAVFKLDYRRGKSLDPLSNEVKGAAFLVLPPIYRNL